MILIEKKNFNIKMSLDGLFLMRFCNEANFIAVEMSLRLCLCPIPESDSASLYANKNLYFSSLTDTLIEFNFQFRLASSCLFCF